MYLLDTNVCIAWLTGRLPAVRDRAGRLDPRRLYLCSVVKAELLFGARKSARVDANLALLQVFFEPFRSLDFDDAAAEHYGLVRASLEACGTPIGANDLMIAATALAHDATVVTANTREFHRVVGLRVEDWSA